jgi:hypothetical protein
MRTQTKSNYKPLQPCRMSTPITCIPQKQDMLFHILFGCDEHLMRSLIDESIINIAREYNHGEIHEAVSKLRPNVGKQTVDHLRAKFFLLLNIDMQMRAKLAVVQGKSSIVKELDPHKACVFYDNLRERIIPTFLQNHCMSLEAFIMDIRDTYILS